MIHHPKSKLFFYVIAIFVDYHPHPNEDIFLFPPRTKIPPPTAGRKIHAPLRHLQMIADYCKGFL